MRTFFPAKRPGRTAVGLALAALETLANGSFGLSVTPAADTRTLTTSVARNGFEYPYVLPCWRSNACRYPGPSGNVISKDWPTYRTSTDEVITCRFGAKPSDFNSAFAASTSGAHARCKSAKVTLALGFSTLAE